MILSSVPSFALLVISCFAVMLLVTLVLLFYMALQSQPLFDVETDDGPVRQSLLTVVKKGRLPPSSFILILAAQFIVGTVFILGLNNIRFVDHDWGLGAYVGHNTTKIDVQLSLIPVCNWSDRYPEDRLDRIIAKEDVPLRDPMRDIPEDDQRLIEFQEFADGLGEEFRSQAPDAILNLTERLNPIFAILSAFFLIVARSVLRKDEDPKSYPMTSLLGGGVLALCFVMLGYFLILGYHTSTEVSAAFAAGRIVCVAHVAPFYVAQTQALVVSTVGLAVLFVITPGSIFRKI